MEFPSTTLIEALNYLLPGFLAAGIFFVLTPAARPTPFERIVQALIYTLLVRVAVEGARASLQAAGVADERVTFWFADGAVGASVIIALLLGVVLAWITNQDKLHGLLRKLRVTSQTSYPSEWYGAFAQNKGYVVLHLTGNRRLYGWAYEWPSRPDVGHFVMLHAEWLVENEQLPLVGVNRVVVRATDVEMVEMMQIYTPVKQEETSGRSEATKPPAAVAGERPEG